MKINELPAPALHLLAKLAKPTDEHREALGQFAGSFEVDETFTIHLQGEVKVSKSIPDAIIAQSAQPWALLALALQEANRRFAAANMANIDMDWLVKTAETLDPKLIEKAKEEANQIMASHKEATRSFKWGQVRCSGSAEVNDRSVVAEGSTETKKTA